MSYVSKCHKQQREPLFREWLIDVLNRKRSPENAFWVDEEKGIFAIRWVHASSSTWSKECGDLFRLWKSEGRRKWNKERPDISHKQMKTNFRMNLRSPNFMELTKKDELHEESPVRKFQLVKLPRKAVLSDRAAMKGPSKCKSNQLLFSPTLEASRTFSGENHPKSSLNPVASSSLVKSRPDDFNICLLHPGAPPSSNYLDDQTIGRINPETYYSQYFKQPCQSSSAPTSQLLTRPSAMHLLPIAGDMTSNFSGLPFSNHGSDFSFSQTPNQLPDFHTTTEEGQLDELHSSFEYDLCDGLQSIDNIIRSPCVPNEANILPDPLEEIISGKNLVTSPCDSGFYDRLSTRSWSSNEDIWWETLGEPNFMGYQSNDCVFETKTVL